MKFSGDRLPTNASYSIGFGEPLVEQPFVFTPPEWTLEDYYNFSYVPVFQIRIKNRVSYESFTEKVSTEFEIDIHSEWMVIKC